MHALHSIYPAHKTVVDKAQFAADGQEHIFKCFLFFWEGGSCSWGFVLKYEDVYFV